MRNSGEMESTSSSERRNSGCVEQDREKHGRRADLLFKSTRSEFGCCEAGKEDHGNEGTKEKFESKSESSKNDEEHVAVIIISLPHAKGLVIVGYII